LILGPRRPPADIDVLRRLQKQCGAFDLGELRTQPPDDLAGRNIALIYRDGVFSSMAPWKARVGDLGAAAHDEAPTASKL